MGQTNTDAIVEVSPALLRALRDPTFYPHPADRVEVIETHISWIFLAGEYAYKLKKPVKFGFLDFSTPELRRHFCAQELKLNQRYAAQIYLGLVGFGPSPQEPVWGGSPPIETAVRMRRFPESGRLDHLQSAGLLGPREIDAFASRIAQFHQHAARADQNSPFGSVQVLRETLDVNFRTLREATGPSQAGRIDALEHWSDNACARLAPLIDARRQAGAVRECHGDLHLANMVWFNDDALLFDCIEFNEGLRWIDTLNDIAFMLMDLEGRGERALANRFLDRYLVATGDYEGTALLPLFKQYRALVRAAVTALRLHQPALTSGERAVDRHLVHRYLELAESYMRAQPPRMILMHGLPGSGKTTVAAQIAPVLNAVCLHSDVERKRLAGIGATERSASPLDGGIYTASASEATYGRLRTLTSTLLRAGQSVIVDAAFADRSRRLEFIELAKQCGAQARIISMDIPPDALRARVARREGLSGEYSEAGLAVLEQALARHEPLDGKELDLTLRVGLAGRIEAIVESILGAPTPHDTSPPRSSR